MSSVRSADSQTAATHDHAGSRSSHDEGEADGVESTPKAATEAGPAQIVPLREMPRAAYLTLVGGWFALFCGFGMTNAFGVFEVFYRKEVLTTTSDSSISWIGSLQIFFILAANVISGPLLDKVGPRPLMLTYALLFAFACMMTSLCHEFYQYILAQGVALGIALSFGFTPPLTCAIRWWGPRAPIAVAVVVSGSSMGGVIWPIVANALIVHVGLGWAWRAIGFIGLGLISIAVALITDPVQAMRAQKALEAQADAQEKGLGKGPPLVKTAFFYPEMLKVTSYQLVTFGFGVTWLGFLYLFYFTPTLAQLYGASQSLSFYSISVLNATSVFGRLCVPLLVPKVGVFNLVTVCLICSAIVTLCSIAVNTVAGALVTGAFYGIVSGGAISLISPSLASITPDKTRLGASLGQSIGLVAIPALLGPPIAGWIIGSSGRFDAAAGFAGACIMLGAIFIFLAKVTSKGFLAIA